MKLIKVYDQIKIHLQTQNSSKYCLPKLYSDVQQHSKERYEEAMMAMMNTTDNEFPLKIIPLFFFQNSKMFKDNDDGTIKRDHAHPSTRPDMKGYIKVSIDISLHEQTMHGLR